MEGRGPGHAGIQLQAHTGMAVFTQFDDSQWQHFCLRYHSVGLAALCPSYVGRLPHAEYILGSRLHYGHCH